MTEVASAGCDRLRLSSVTSSTVLWMNYASPSRWCDCTPQETRTRGTDSPACSSKHGRNAFTAGASHSSLALCTGTLVTSHYLQTVATSPRSRPERPRDHAVRTPLDLNPMGISAHARRRCGPRRPFAEASRSARSGSVLPAFSRAWSSVTRTCRARCGATLGGPARAVARMRGSPAVRVRPAAPACRRRHCAESRCV